MTPPRWLRDQRRAQARLDRVLADLPATLEQVKYGVVGLQMAAIRLSDEVRQMNQHISPPGPIPGGPIRWTS